MVDRKMAKKLDKEGSQKEVSQTYERVNSSLKERGEAPTSAGNTL
ncbi:hypothetical protein ACQV2W_02930 [Facklamia sp. P12934]